MTTASQTALAEGSATAAPSVAPTTTTAPARRVEIPAPVDRIRQSLADLKLTGEQKASVETVLRSAAAEFRGMVPDLQMKSEEDRADTLRDFVKGVQTKVAAVLNDDQKAGFEQKMDTFRQNIGGRVGPMIERLQAAVEHLNLDDAQKAKARDVVKTAIEKMKLARQDVAGDAQVVRQKSLAVLAEAREKLREILSAEQQEKLMELMRPKGEPNRAGEGRRRPEPEPNAKPPGEMKDMKDPPPAMNGAPTTRASGAPGSDTPAKPEVIQSAAATGALDPGKPAPPIALTRLDGQSQPQAFKGRVTVLVFGNYSTPTFRQRAADIDAMRKELASRASVYIVYTRESHPVGGWEVQRNKDDGIQVEQPKDQDARMRTARLAKDALKIATPILVDTMDDAAATAYDGFTNAAVVIGRDGTIAARQKWFDPYTLRRSIDEAVNAKPTTRP